jgi:hypothetical protein
MPTVVSEKHITSILGDEEYTKEESSVPDVD